eukprot:COSAG05_NODE_2355_length_3187_cov_12.245790_1_plen_121_part_10
MDSITPAAAGYLDKNEARSFLLMNGCAETEIDYYLADLLRLADKDGDGNISKTEFLSYVLGDEELDARGDFKTESRSSEMQNKLAHIRDMALRQRMVMHSPAARLVGAVFDLIDDDVSQPC